MVISSEIWLLLCRWVKMNEPILCDIYLWLLSGLLG